MGLKLNTASSGSVTLEPANTASNYTLTVPAQTGTVAINGPAFSAYQSTNTSVTANTITKIGFQTENWDTASCYDTSLSRFTPNVAGYYLCSASVQVPGGPTRAFVGIYKNGSNWRWLTDSASIYNPSGSCVVYLNGSTDYVEVYLYVTASGNTSNAETVTWFQGTFLRS